MMLSRCLKLAVLCGALATVAACGKDDAPAEQPDMQPDMQPDVMPEPDPMPADVASDPLPPPPPPPTDDVPDEIEEFVDGVEKGLMLAMALQAAIENNYKSRGELPTSVDDLGAAARMVPDAGEGVESLTVEDGVIVIDYAASGDLSGGTIRMTPTPGADGLEWDCSGGTLPAEYRPDECR